MTTLVIGRDSDINELGWGVGIAERNNRNVDIRSLLDSLGISAGISDDDEAGFLEGSSDVVGEVTRSETTGDSNSTGVCGKLQDSTLTIGTSGDDTDVSWVVDCCNDTGSEDNFLPA